MQMIKLRKWHDLYSEILILTCSNSLALGRQPVMLHPESVLALIHQVGRVAREWVTDTRYIRRVRNLPLDILVDLRLLRLRRSSVSLIVRPIGSSCLAVLSRFITIDGDLRSPRHRGRVVPRSLPRGVRRGDAVDDRRLVVARNVRHDLLTVPCRAPVSEVRKTSRRHVSLDRVTLAISRYSRSVPPISILGKETRGTAMFTERSRI